MAVPTIRFSVCGFEVRGYEYGAGHRTLHPDDWQRMNALDTGSLTDDEYEDWRAPYRWMAQGEPDPNLPVPREVYADAR